MDGFQFCGQANFIVLGTADFQHTLGFRFRFDRFVEVIEYRQRGFFELRSPVERAALCGGGAVREHPVHAVFVNEANQALGELFNRFVERFGRAVAVLAEHFVLRFHHASQAAHQDAAFADEVGSHFFFKGGREQVAGADTDTERHATLFGAAGGVLEYAEAGVDARASQEVAAYVQAGAFWSNQKYVHIGRRNDFGQVFVNDRKAVAEIKGIACFQVALDLRPAEFLSGVGKQVLNDRSLLNRFFDFEQGFAGDEAVLDGAVPVLHELLGLTDDDVEAVVAQIQRLGRALYAVTDNRDNFVLQNFAGLRQRKLFAGDDGFFSAAEINNCHGLSP